MPAPLVSDMLWSIIQPLLPSESAKPKGGRPRVGSRAALTGILFVLRTGIAWEMLPQEMGCGSGVTCWRRLRDWQAAEVWDRPHRELLRRLQHADRIDWSRALHGQLVHRGQKGGAETGPNPTDRGKPGTKQHLVTDQQGVPLAVRLTGANVHDSKPFEDLLDAIPQIPGKRGRPRYRPTNSTPIRPITSVGAERPAGIAASRLVSPGAASKPAKSSANIAGSSNAASLG